MNPYHRQRLRWLAWIGFGLVLSGLLVCVGLSGTHAQAATRSATGSLKPDDILEEPRRYQQQWVTVEGEVLRSLGKCAFVLRRHWGSQGLLVVLTENTPGETPRVGEWVRVAGTVRSLSWQEAGALQQRLGLAPQAGLQRTFGQRPYVEGQEVTTLE